ncbi:carbohydrate esterase family 12 protein [Xylariaceae sp. FL0255]|nr:carbohydrate esterase family 12 protein [Xylariaceae sp. FL0255]
MKASFLPVALALCVRQAAASPAGPHLAARAPTVYLCGDSTMAAVSNQAIAGRSARSYWEEGRFADVADLAKAGDIMRDDNGRSDCYGDGEETCVSDTTGETVYTFVFYVIEASKLMTAKGATVILSSQTPDNPWETGVFVYSPPRFVGYDLVAKNTIDASTVTFVDHFQAVSNTYEDMGDIAVNALYPNDHTHTSPTGANIVAEAFIQAIHAAENGTTSLASYVISNPPTVY